jgi:hypothetical protein
MAGFRKAAGKKDAPAKGKSRFAGVKAAGDRTPQLGPGKYRLKLGEPFVSRERSEYYFAPATVVEVLDDRREDSSDPGVGDECLAMLQCIAGDSRRPGYARIKAFAIAIAGAENEAEYDADYDPDGLFCEHVLNDGSDGLDEDGEPYEPIEGREVIVTVRKGKPTKDGLDYYRENSFEPVGEQ